MSFYPMALGLAALIAVFIKHQVRAGADNRQVAWSSPFPPRAPPSGRALSRLSSRRRQGKPLRFSSPAPLLR